MNASQLKSAIYNAVDKGKAFNVVLYDDHQNPVEIACRPTRKRGFWRMGYNDGQPAATIPSLASLAKHDQQMSPNTLLKGLQEAVDKLKAAHTTRPGHEPELGGVTDQVSRGSISEDGILSSKTPTAAGRTAGIHGFATMLEDVLGWEPAKKGSDSSADLMYTDPRFRDLNPSQKDAVANLAMENGLYQSWGPSTLTLHPVPNRRANTDSDRAPTIQVQVGDTFEAPQQRHSKDPFPSLAKGTITITGMDGQNYQFTDQSGEEISASRPLIDEYVANQVWVKTSGPINHTASRTTRLANLIAAGNWRPFRCDGCGEQTETDQQGPNAPTMCPKCLASPNRAEWSVSEVSPTENGYEVTFASYTTSGEHGVRPRTYRDFKLVLERSGNGWQTHMTGKAPDDRRLSHSETDPIDVVLSVIAN